MADDRNPDLSAEDIARIDKLRYKEPGRDLTASKPVEAMGAGARGDATSAAQDVHTHGAARPDEGAFGSDERPFLAEKDKPFSKDHPFRMK